MKVITPTEVTGDNLSSSTIAEPDTGEIVWVAHLSVVGEERINITTHRVYKATVASTDDPLNGINKDVPTWVDARATNKFAMFDNKNSTKSSETTQLITEIEAGFINNSVAGFGIEQVNNINIIVDDPIDGIVFDEDVNMSDNSKVTDWYLYFTSPIVKKTEFVVTGLPMYGNAVIKMTADGNEIKFGNLVIGNELDLGVENTKTKLSLVDFSTYEVDDFGNTSIKPGLTAKLVNYEVTIDEGDESRVFNIVSSLTGIVAVWVGDVTDSSLSFGYYKGHSVVLDYTFSQADFTIQGVV